MAVMTAQSLDWRFSQSTGAGLRILSSSRESSSFFKLCPERDHSGSLVKPGMHYKIFFLPGCVHDSQLPKSRTISTEICMR